MEVDTIIGFVRARACMKLSPENILIKSKILKRNLKEQESYHKGNILKSFHISKTMSKTLHDCYLWCTDQNNNVEKKAFYQIMVVLNEDKAIFLLHQSN